MNKQEIEKIKKEYKELIVKLKELSEDELSEVTGGSYTIDGIEPIHFDFSDLFTSPSPNNLRLLNDKAEGNIKTGNVSITGNINNRIDYSEPEKWVPLFGKDQNENKLK